jgi:hypothetical protein
VATEFLRVFEHYRFRDRLKTLANAYDTTLLPSQSSMLLGPAEDAGPVWLVPPDAVEAAAPVAQVLGFTIDNIWLDETGVWIAPYLVEGHPKRRERAVFAAEG